MIYGIGTDIVAVERIKAGLERFGTRYAQKILTPTELLDYGKDSRPAHFLAKRFAAKEAAAKALGLGMQEGVAFCQIGVGHDEKGKPLLEFFGRAEQFCREHGVCGSHISLSDEKCYAVAFVILLCGEN